MTLAGNYDELEFELALTGVLEDIYDLKVRTDRDLLNRRRTGYTTLEFQYQYDESSSEVKVVLSVKGETDSSFVLHADFRDADTISESAENCEEVALALRRVVDGENEQPDGGRRLDDERSPDGRRWDD